MKLQAQVYRDAAEEFHYLKMVGFPDNEFIHYADEFAEYFNNWGLLSNDEITLALLFMAEIVEGE